MIYNYDRGLNLPENFESIIEQDLWILDSVNLNMLRTFSGPAKFSTFTSIFVKRGECKANINLVSHEIKGPCVININPSQILQPEYISEDFDASFMVMSKRMTENIFLFLRENPIYPVVRQTAVAPISSEIAEDMKMLYKTLQTILAASSNPNIYFSALHAILAFFFFSGHKIYEPFRERTPASHGKLADRFIFLVQQNFKKERFLEFYAAHFGISTKHLSRAVKKETGFTAVEWIERYVILEAKALLKSSNFNVQQISDMLNFRSQSVFGKYFKKYVGKTPTEFRNG